MTPIYNPYSQIVYSGNGRDVSDIIINEKIFYRDRRFITLDRDDIMNEVKRLSELIKNN
jgi:5-methylthioadenosine/S-adenosylhomocysteine deaminase